MKIRNTTKRDIKEIAILMLDEFSKKPFKEKSKINPVIKSLDFYFKIGKAFVATEDSQITGVVIFKVEQWWHGPVVIIEDLAVRQHFKKAGVGHLLLNKVEHYAKGIKAKQVSFATNKKSSAMIKEYKKQGYKIEKNTILMSKVISKK